MSEFAFTSMIIFGSANQSDKSIIMRWIEFLATMAFPQMLSPGLDPEYKLVLRILPTKRNFIAKAILLLFF